MSTLDDACEGLARDIVMWLTMSDRTGHALHMHLARLNEPIPAWLSELIPDTPIVPPKANVAKVIYLAVATQLPQGKWERLTYPDLAAIVHQTMSESEAPFLAIPFAEKVQTTFIRKNGGE